MTVLFDERNGDVQSSYNNITSTCANYNGVGIPSAGNTIGGAVLTASNISNSGNWDVIVTDHNSSSTIQTIFSWNSNTGVWHRSLWIFSGNTAINNSNPSGQATTATASENFTRSDCGDDISPQTNQNLK